MSEQSRDRKISEDGKVNFLNRYLSPKYEKK